MDCKVLNAIQMNSEQYYAIVRWWFLDTGLPFLYKTFLTLCTKYLNKAQQNLDIYLVNSLALFPENIVVRKSAKIISRF